MEAGYNAKSPPVPAIAAILHPVHSASINHIFEFGAGAALKNVYLESAFLNNSSHSPTPLSCPLMQASIYHFQQVFQTLDGELTMASKPLIALSFFQVIFPGSGKISSLIKILAPFFNAGIAALSVSIAFSS
jgi:hypothetical protein